MKDQGQVRSPTTRVKNFRDPWGRRAVRGVTEDRPVDSYLSSTSVRRVRRLHSLHPGPGLPSRISEG